MVHTPVHLPTEHLNVSQEGTLRLVKLLQFVRVCIEHRMCIKASPTATSCCCFGKVQLYILRLTEARLHTKFENNPVIQSYKLASWKSFMSPSDVAFVFQSAIN